MIHRDIKPENILLHDGRPVVADFGIALAVSAAAGGRMTETGLSLGTPHYMSPEQATADKDITARSDVYSLGSVLYEMLTGQPPHLGGSAQQIIMKIVTEAAAPVTSMRKSVPPHVAATVARALEKLPADRFETAKAFGDALGDPMFTHRAVTGATLGSRPQSLVRRLLPAAIGLAGLAIGILLGAVLARPDRAPRVVRFALRAPPGTELADSRTSDVPFALSPDGTRIALVAVRPAQKARLYVRGVDRLDAVEVPGTDDAVNPFFAPDGRSLGFVSMVDGRLRRVNLDGGGVTTITDDPVLLYSAPSWGDDGYVVFTGTDFRLRRVIATGGRSEALDAARDPSSSAGQPVVERALAYPAVLPGGRSVVVSVCAQGIYRASGFCSGGIQLLDVATGRRTPLGVDGVRGWYIDGHLVFVSPDGALFAAEFDAASGTVLGDPVSLISGLGAAGQQRLRVTLSRAGGLAYLPPDDAADRVIVLLDRSGREQVIVAEPGEYQWVRLSPDGTRIAMVNSVSGAQQISVYDRRSATASLLTFAGTNHRPSWSPDGRHIAFTSSRGGTSDVWTVPADGSGPGGPVAPGRDVAQLSATSWTRDGAWIVIDGDPDEGVGAGADDIFALPASGTGAMRPIVATPASEQTGEVSPDGQWIAYVSDDAGYFQVYVQPFLRPGGRTLVSVGPAIEPAWASDRELTYTATESGALVLARLELGTSVGVTRTVLFDRSRYNEGTPSWRSYDVSRDGQRFLFTRSRSAARAPAPVVVLDWIAEVRRAIADRRRP